MDGLVTNVSLIAGVGGGGGRHTIVLTGLAGLAAGACSMAAGEFVSVSSQNELIQAEVDKERLELEHNAAAEQAELATMLRARGVSAATARQAAAEISAHPEKALAVHALEELGVDPGELPSPWWPRARRWPRSRSARSSRCCPTWPAWTCSGRARPGRGGRGGGRGHGGPADRTAVLARGATAAGPRRRRRRDHLPDRHPRSSRHLTAVLSRRCFRCAVSGVPFQVSGSAAPLAQPSMSAGLGPRGRSGQVAWPARAGLASNWPPTGTPSCRTSQIRSGSLSSRGSASGSPSTTIRSASLPSATVPMCSSRPSASAAVLVAATRASGRSGRDGSSAGSPGRRPGWCRCRARS